MAQEWMSGVALSLVGNILINLGSNVLKLGHANKARDELQGVELPTHKNTMWLLGMVFFMAGNFATFFSYGYAAASILAAMGCIRFVSNMLFAYLVLREQVTRHIIGATALILGGCVLLVVFGSHSSGTFRVSDLPRLYGSPGYIGYLAGGAAAVILTYAAYLVGQRQLRRKHEGVKLARWRAALPVLFSVFSGIICTQALVFNKILMVLWRTTLAGDQQFNKFITWLFVVGFLATSTLGVVQLNAGLRMFPALIIVPAMQLSQTLFGVVSGMVFFHEYVGMRSLEAGMFVLGVSLVCAGAYELTHAPHGPHSPPEKAMELQEEDRGGSPASMPDRLAQKQALQSLAVVVDGGTALQHALSAGAAACSVPGQALPCSVAAAARMRRTTSSGGSWQLGTGLVNELDPGAVPAGVHSDGMLPDSSAAAKVLFLQGGMASESEPGTSPRGPEGVHAAGAAASASNAPHASVRRASVGGSRLALAAVPAVLKVPQVKQQKAAATVLHLA